MLNLVLRGWISSILKTLPPSAMYVTENARCSKMLEHISVEFCESISFHLRSYPGCTDVPKAVGGYFVLWPLFAAGSRPDAHPITRKWIIERLEFIAHCMGIQQASSIARRLRAL
jgi:hypothetical protein